MAKKQKTETPITEQAGVGVAVAQANEPWSEYKLSDGTLLKIKQVIVEIRRITGKYTEKGDPVYVIKGAQVVDITAPKKLLRKGKK